MARMVLLLVLAASVGSLAGCFGPTPPYGDAPGKGREDLQLQRVWDDLDQPLLVTHDGQRAFVVEQCGQVLVATQTGLQPWLDVQVTCDGERGLLGLAFPPDHDETRRFYVSYTDAGGASVLERRTVDAAGGPEDAAEVLLKVDQPAANHNGGHIEFGPDGMLYYGLGDGGAAGDPWGNAQDPGTLLGSILRLDVSGNAYTAPPDNPFVGRAGRDEVWSHGLRNPWRFSFDEAGGMWIGDVGQDCWEEINHEPAGAGGRNYGWPRFEGSHPSELPACSDTVADVDGYMFPVAEVRTSEHCSVTGGHFMANGTPPLREAYVFGDYCSGTIWTLRAEGDGWQMEELMETSLRISSFGLDAENTLYVIDHQGGVHRFV